MDDVLENMHKTTMLGQTLIFWNRMLQNLS